MMRLPFYLLLVCSFVCSSLYGQNVPTKELKGKLVDSLGTFIPGATIKLMSPKDTLSTSSDDQGEFKFKQVQSPNFKLNIYSLGYLTVSRSYQINDKSESISLDNIILQEEPIEL